MTAAIMADSEVKIKITGDAKSAETALGRVKEAIDKTVTALNGVRGAIGKVFAALGIAGFVLNGINSLCDGYKKIKEWLNRAETAAKQLREEIEQQSYENSIKNAEQAYKKLNDQIARANQLERERNQILDERKSRNRDLEDAQNALAKAKEIAALDPNSDDYAERKQAIETKYERHESRKAAQRAGYDVKLQEYRLRQDAWGKDKEAGKNERLAGGMKDRGFRLLTLMQRMDTGRDKYDPERYKTLQDRRDEYVNKYNEYAGRAQTLRDESSGLKRMADEIAKRVGQSSIRDEATQLTITQREREQAALRAREEAKAKADEERKQQEEENRRQQAENRRQQAAAKEKARAESEAQSKVLKEKSDKASQLDSFADRLAATDGISQNRLTALGLGSGVAPRQNQIANDVKQLVKLMKDEIEATKNIATDGDSTATFTE